MSMTDSRAHGRSGPVAGPGVGRHLLIVDDDDRIRELLKEFLAREGYRVTGAAHAAAARRLMELIEFDLVVLDLMLPHVDGSVLLAEFRRHSDLPVLVLSAKDAVYTKVDVLRLGADDYVTKPFDLEELTARVEVLLRRSAPPDRPAPRLVHGDLVVDPQHARATRGDRELELTATEFRILELLMTQPGRVLSRPTIYEAVWEEPFVADDAAVKTHLSNLRTKLRAVGPDEDPIETVWGLGYRMRALPTGA